MDIDSYHTRILKQLNAYIVLHDEVFAWSWRKLFKRIDYGLVLIQVGEVRTKLSEILSELHADAGIKDAEYIEALRGYVGALVSTQNAFSRLLMGLVRKSEGGEYPISKYKEEVAIYDEMLERYTKLGKEVHEMNMRRTAE